MCIIIHKRRGKTIIDPEILNASRCINKDGFGIVYLDNGEMIKTMDYEYADELVKASRPFVAHYRYTTRGKTCEDNCHPFPFGGVGVGESDSWLFANGTVADLGNKTKTDSQVVAEYLDVIPEEHWSKVLSMTDVRFATVRPADPKASVAMKVQRYGNWHQHGGVWYSKKNVLPGSSEFNRHNRPYSCYSGSYYSGPSTTYRKPSYSKPSSKPTSSKPSSKPKKGITTTPPPSSSGWTKTDKGWRKSYDYASGSKQDSYKGKSPDKDESPKEYHDRYFADNDPYTGHVYGTPPTPPSSSKSPTQRIASKRAARSAREFKEMDDDAHFDINHPWAGNNIVGVYGTLKRGHGNHHLINADESKPNQLKSDYLGYGLTKDSLRMTIKGVPYLHSGHNTTDGTRILLELYEVHSPKARVALDQLEGHPHHYRRRMTQVELSDGTFIPVWVYMIDEEPSNGEEIYYYYPRSSEGQRAEYLCAYSKWGKFDKDSKITISPTNAEIAYAIAWSDKPYTLSDVSASEVIADTQGGLDAEEAVVREIEEERMLNEELKEYEIIEYDPSFQQYANDGFYLEVEDDEEEGILDDAIEAAAVEIEQEQAGELPPLADRLRLKFLRS